MYSIEFKVDGLDKLKMASKKRGFFKPYISQAVEASLFEVSKNSFDSAYKSNYYYNFVEPDIAPGKRTGKLAATFIKDIADTAKAISFAGDRVTAEVHSLMHYADIVAADNDFYTRILDATRKNIDKQFDAAVALAMKDLGLA